MAVGWDYELTDVDRLLEDLYWQDLWISVQGEGDPSHEDPSHCLVYTGNGNWLGYVTKATTEKLIATGRVYWRDRGSLRYHYTDERPYPAEYRKVTSRVYYHLPGEYHTRWVEYETTEEIHALARENPGIPIFKFGAGYYWGNIVWTEEDGFIKDKAELPKDPTLWERLPWHRRYVLP